MFDSFSIRRANITEEKYINECLPTPTKKVLLRAEKPSPKRLTRIACVLLAFLILGVFLLFSAVLSYIRYNKIKDLIEDPGAEYIEWINSFGSVEMFDELEEGWKVVEKAWKKRGVSIDWAFVTDVKDGFRTDIYSDEFHEELMSEIYIYGDDQHISGSSKIIGLFITLIPLIFCAIKTKKAYDKWCDDKKKFATTTHENEERQKYNEVELPKLLAEREKTLPQVRADYRNEINSVQTELTEVEQAIAQRAHLLPQFYHENAADIASILMRGRADTVKEAINVFEEDQRAAELADIERERAAAEKRHRDAMEYEARRANENAERAARQAQERNDAALKQRQKAAGNRCVHCANSCDSSVRSGFWKTGDVCPNYRPNK